MRVKLIHWIGLKQMRGFCAEPTHLFQIVMRPTRLVRREAKAFDDNPAFCDKTGQPIPKSEGAVIRIILESLALEYRITFDRLTKLTGSAIEVIHIVGGGTQNQLLNQLTANATGVPVIAGPIEATVIGNALIQLIALGELDNLQDARQVVARSGKLKRYDPQDTADWDEAYHRYQDL